MGWVLEKEWSHLLSVLVVLAFVGAFVEFGFPSLPGFLVMLIVFLVIIFTHVFSKKLVSYHLSMEEESRVWSVKRYGFKKHHYFASEVPLGLVLPIFIFVITLGLVPWYGSLQSEVKPSKYKSVRRKNFQTLLSFTEVSEWDLALVSASGVAGVLVLSFFAYLIGVPIISKVALHYAFFNMIPFGNLDGSRILFGSRPLYAVLGAITLIGLLYSFFLI